jgi:hypothetical protein
MLNTSFFTRLTQVLKSRPFLRRPLTALMLLGSIPLQASRIDDLSAAKYDAPHTSLLDMLEKQSTHPTRHHLQQHNRIVHRGLAHGLISSCITVLAVVATCIATIVSEDLAYQQKANRAGH